jgi:hypothetical protein
MSHLKALAVIGAVSVFVTVIVHFLAPPELRLPLSIAGGVITGYFVGFNRMDIR